MIGICLIGAGRAGMIHARNYKNKVDGAQLVAVADPVRAALDSAMAELEMEHGYEDYRAALEDRRVDAVVIVSPTKYHLEIAVAAAEAGKHILCEKPMAMNEAECDEMMRAAEKRGVVLQIGFMRRHDESFRLAKDMLDSGEIGDAVLVKSHTRGPSTPQPWMYDISKSNGPLAEVNSHDIDTLHWFTGSTFKSLYAIGGNYRSPEAAVQFPDFYDNLVLSGTFKNGAMGSIDGAQGVAYGYDAHTEIVGTKGVLHVGRTQDSFVCCSTRDGGTRSPFISSWRKLFSDAYLAEDAHFVQCIQNGLTPRVTGEDGRQAVRVVEAGNRSIREKRIVTLED